MSHTPGDWYVSETVKTMRLDNCIMIRTDSDHSGIIGITGKSDGPIIAAAPKMLRALIKAEAVLKTGLVNGSDNPADHEAHKEVVEAIAAATGQRNQGGQS